MYVILLFTSIFHINTFPNFIFLDVIVGKRSMYFSLILLILEKYFGCSKYVYTIHVDMKTILI